MSMSQEAPVDAYAQRPVRWSAATYQEARGED